MADAGLGAEEAAVEPEGCEFENGGKDAVDPLGYYVELVAVRKIRS